MALVLVLMVSSIIVMMTGALFQANQANFAGLSASEHQREAELVAESAAEFVYYHLERNQKFAQDPGQNNVLRPSRALKVSSVSPTRDSASGKYFCTILGSLENTGGRAPEFKVVVYNNLDRGAPHTIDGVTVPKDSALIKVTGRSAGFEAHNDILYRGEPLFDASVTANNGIYVGTNKHLELTSQDSERNWLRSNGEISLNDFINGGDKTKIRSQNGGPKGVVWAKGDISSNGKRLGVDPGAGLDEAARESGGIFAPKSRLNHDIYKLTVNDLKVSNLSANQSQTDVATGTSAQKAGWMRAGTYTLSWEQLALGGTVYNVHALKQQRADGQTYVYYDGRGLQGSAVGLPSDGLICWDGIVDFGGSDDGGAVKFKFDDHAFIADDSEIEVLQSPETSRAGGDLIIKSEIEGVIPKVKLVSSDSSSGVLRSTGNIRIQGTIEGDGALVAGGDLALACNPQAYSDQGASVDAQQSAQGSGVVLFGKNVTVFGASSDEIEFKGLIYAEEHVNFWGGAKLEPVQLRDSQGRWLFDAEGKPVVQVQFIQTNDTLKKLHLQGAVVARTGDVHITNTDEVTLDYDPAYLKTLTKGMPNDRRRVARAWTRSY